MNTLNPVVFRIRADVGCLHPAAKYTGSNGMLDGAKGMRHKWDRGQSPKIGFQPFPLTCITSIAAHMAALIYKICPRPLWREAEDTGVFHGAPIDLSDGFIHFSTAEQMAETAAKHFSGQNDLLLIAVDAGALGDALRYEVSRGGALFPHLYGPLALDTVHWVKPLPLGQDGMHVFPGPAE